VVIVEPSSPLSSAQAPTASLLLFAYNHEAFIEEALRSALRQDLDDYELVIVDDASTDGTRAKIEAILAAGGHAGRRIKTIFHDRNQGVLAAVNAAMAQASGDVFVMMAGDDISLPDRLQRTLRIFAAAPEVQLAYGEVAFIDERGAALRPAPTGGMAQRFAYARARFGRIYAGALPCGASAAYRRRLYDVFGPMRVGPHGEDNCYWVRALLLGEIHHDPACFIQWRQHSANLSNYQPSAGDAWRLRHLDWMEKHAGMSSQWLQDIAVARTQGLISVWRAAIVRYAAIREDATRSLEVASLRPDPWGSWLRSAWKLLQVGRLSTTFRMLKLRLFRSRREKRWQVLAKLKSNGPV
jgi:glycosyltransferase involved in cell wall biosynthesis